MYFKDLIVAIILIGVMVVLERLARRKQAKTAQKLVRNFDPAPIIC